MVVEHEYDDKSMHWTWCLKKLLFSFHFPERSEAGSP